MRDAKINKLAVAAITNANALGIYVWLKGMDVHSYTAQEVLAHFKNMCDADYVVAFNHLKSLGLVEVTCNRTGEFCVSGEV